MVARTPMNMKRILIAMCKCLVTVIISSLMEVLVIVGRATRVRTYDVTGRK